ncbi:MAG: alpha/beta fold hydrolase [Clostridia bacterium]|nr:alpha/beta fold hydrolase [Clostridia bacterium]
MKTKRRITSRLLLCLALILCLISSIGASSVQSSYGEVKVEDLRIVVGDGTHINGQVYIPKKASAENPAPLIVVSHGSYNNMDMQDLNMIELSRRGFVVISSDAYNHGSSSRTPADVMGLFPAKNMYQLIDYALASYNFIDKEKVAVSGHSMGGIISNYTVQHYFEQEARGEGPNPIAAVLDVGYDPQYTAYTFEGVEGEIPLTVDWGVICAKYDEWFFKGDTGNPALYLQSANANTFINQLEGVNLEGAVENRKIYTGTIGGEEYIRAIYQNTEIHPMNHFSTDAAAAAVEFFYEALGVPGGYEKIDPYDQIWQRKEAFNFVGLIGIFLFLFPFASLVMDAVPFFSKLKAEKAMPMAPALADNNAKIRYWVTYAIGLVIPALLVMPVMLNWVGAGISVPAKVTPWFGEPNTNELAAWTCVVGLALLALFLIVHKLFNKDVKGIPACWGVKISLKNLGKTFLLALMTVGVAYVILFFSDLVFNTDYRVWMIAMRVFEVDKVLYAIAYFPAFLVFYLVNAMLTEGSNQVAGRSRWLATLLTCISNIAGIGTLIFIQYYVLITQGVLTYNSMRIVNLFPLLVLIPAATIISRRFYKKTGSIYAGAMVMSMLYTMMTVANTMTMASILG